MPIIKQGYTSKKRPNTSWNNDTTYIEFNHLEEMRSALTTEVQTRMNLEKEQPPKTLSLPSWTAETTYILSSEWKAVKKAIDDCRNFDVKKNSSLKKFSYTSSYEPGDIITKNGLTTMRNYINILQNTCVCDCNWTCTCNCDHCACDCNHCACDCNVCSCQSDYKPPSCSCDGYTSGGSCACQNNTSCPCQANRPSGSTCIQRIALGNGWFPQNCNRNDQLIGNDEMKTLSYYFMPIPFGSINGTTEIVYATDIIRQGSKWNGFSRKITLPYPNSNGYLKHMYFKTKKNEYGAGLNEIIEMDVITKIRGAPCAPGVLDIYCDGNKRVIYTNTGVLVDVGIIDQLTNIYSLMPYYVPPTPDVDTDPFSSVPYDKFTQISSNIPIYTAKYRAWKP